jgi:hypothetical protein
MGPRRGDILTLRRQNLTDEDVLFIQSKTKAAQLIEWSDELHSIIDRCKALKPQVPGEFLIRTRAARPTRPPASQRTGSV